MPDDTPDSDSDTGVDAEPGPPADVVQESARLTRLARDAENRDATVAGPFQERVDADSTEEASLYRDRRDELLDRYGYVARVREDREGGATLVCYPADWLDDDGIVRLDAELDLDRAVERALAGPGEQGDFEAAVADNDALVETIEAEYGELHAANVRSFADFMSNHYARAAVSASAMEVREFLEHYYPRNAWPTPEQAEQVEESLRYAFEVRDKQYPIG